MDREAQPTQSPEGIFLDLGYREGQVFSRTDCLGYSLGHATYAGEYYENCDGIVMKFNDGGEVLSDFCRLVTVNSPDYLWAVTKDMERLETLYRKKIDKIIQEYKLIK